MTAITAEQIEALAHDLESCAEEARNKLIRLIKAYARILVHRDPGLFKARALEERDEPGHYDSSYPPSIELCNFSGPHLLQVIAVQTEDIPTSGGFYHEWKRVTTDPGLYVRGDGTLFGCNETGTGAVGQFAAHPGDHRVKCDLDWSPLDDAEVPSEHLRQAEAKLRGLVFPTASKMA